MASIYEEEIKSILEDKIGVDVTVGVDVVDKNKNVAICYFKANDHVFPLTAKPVKDKKNLNKLGMKLESEALKLCQDQKSLNRIIKIYMDTIEADILQAVEDEYVDTDEKFEDLRDYPTESSPVDNPYIIYDKGSANKKISLDEAKELFGEE